MWYGGPMVSEARVKPLGRPRRASTDDAILRAARELLVEAGVAGTTIRAICERAGVARATVYLRWRSREQLIAAALRSVLGVQPYPLSGDLEADIRRAGPQTRAILGRAEVQAVLPELVRALLSGNPAMTYDTLAPNRLRVASEYETQAAEVG